MLRIFFSGRGDTCQAARFVCDEGMMQLSRVWRVFPITKTRRHADERTQDMVV